MTLGNQPYKDVARSKLLGLLKDGQRLPKPSATSREIYALMLQCKFRLLSVCLSVYLPFCTCVCVYPTVCQVKVPSVHMLSHRLEFSS
jgi:hypothetical protein